MTKEDIIELAREAGFERLGHTAEDWVCHLEDIEAFAKLLAEKALREALAEQPVQQEPVAWEQFYPDIGKPQIAFNAEVIGYVAPQRKWVGLTQEEKHEIRYSHMTSAEFIEFIEAKLKDKNTRGQE